MVPPNVVPPRLPTEHDLHAAIVWRLADWTSETVAAGMAALGAVVDSGHCLDGGDPAMAGALRRLAEMQPAEERRDAWSAACALLALLGEARGDWALHWRAGQVVLRAYQQAARGAKPRRQDALDELLGEYLARHPKATAATLFRHCQSLACARLVVIEATADELGYERQPGDPLRYVTRRAFEVRVSRVRQRMQAQAAAAGEGAGTVRPKLAAGLA